MWWNKKDGMPVHRVPVSYPATEFHSRRFLQSPPVRPDPPGRQDSNIPLLGHQIDSSGYGLHVLNQV